MKYFEGVVLGMDVLTKEQRSKNMKAIKAKDTKIEILLRKILWNRGYRYRKNYNKLIGKPDIVLLKYKIAIFCDSEFWHGKDWEIRRNNIKTNSEFWINKIEGNIKRDQIVNQKLQEDGWIVLRFWGEEILKNVEECISKIEKSIMT